MASLRRNLCLLVLYCCVSISVSIARIEQVRSHSVETPASLQQLANGYVPTDDEVHWSNHDFIAGMTFGVMSCGIVLALLMGCQVLRLAPLEQRSQCEAGVPPVDDPHVVPGRVSETSEVETLNLFWPRVGWLAAMLMLQSVSSFILSKFEYLVRKDSDLIFFLTMIIGLGGNAGGQSVVLTCRKLVQHEPILVRDQMVTGILIGLVLAPLSFFRGLIAKSDFRTCLVLAAATLAIASVATTVGTALPKVLKIFKADPGEAAAMIQVIMDIAGVVLTCSLGALILEAF